MIAGPKYHEVTSESRAEEWEFVIDADLVFSHLNGRFRLLGDLITSTEEIELERIQFGMQLREGITGWIGTLRMPSNYWNFNYLHGQYLQTTITRPNIEQFEDNAGLIAGRSELLVEGKLAAEQGIQHVEQSKPGVCADWRRDKRRLISSVVRVRHKMFRQSSSETKLFYSDYIRAEYELDYKWTMFGRLESTTDQAITEYLELFSHYILPRRLLCLRFDLLKNQAMTIELYRAEIKSEELDRVIL